MSPMAPCEAVEPDDLFEVQAVRVMREVRMAFLSLIENLPVAADRPGDLERTLRVSGTLAWQIHRLASASNPLAVGKLVPGPNALKQVLRAARGEGVDEQLLERVAKATEHFEKLIDRHAGDRPTFVAMINSLAGGEVEMIDLKTRKQAFRINSQLWGVQVKVALGCALFYPGEDPSVYNIASVRGMRDVRRLRPRAVFRLTGHRAMGASHLAEPTAFAADRNLKSKPSAVLAPVPLTEFCSKPCPTLEHRLENGYVETYLRDAPLGNAGKQSIYLASALRDVRWIADGSLLATRNAVSRKPTEVLLVDTLIHEDVFGPEHPQPHAKVYGSLDRVGELEPENFREEEELPIRVDVQNLGAGLSALPTSHVPRYAEMVETLCQRVSVDPEKFSVWRCILEYPMLGSVVSVRFPVSE